MLFIVLHFSIFFHIFYWETSLQERAPHRRRLQFSR